MPRYRFTASRVHNHTWHDDPTILRALSCKAMSAKAYASQIVDELSAGDGRFDALWKSRKETESVLDFPLSAK
jgi:hypothetical protein